MKTFIIFVSITFLALISEAQGVIAQVDEVNVGLQAQDGILLINTIGEPIVGVDFNEGIALISGFYPFLLFDTTGTSGIPGFLPVENLTALPNPVKDHLLLRVGEETHPQFVVETIDPNGKTLNLLNWEAGRGAFEISFGNLAPGTYIVRVSETVEQRMSHFKIVKH